MKNLCKTILSCILLFAAAFLFAQKTEIKTSKANRQIVKTETEEPANRIINSTDCKGYLCSETNPEDCSCESGICCLGEIIVKPSFNFRAFDILINEKNPDALSAFVKENVMNKNLENFLTTESGKKIIEGIINQKLSVQKMKSSKDQNQYLIKANSKNEYIGHVTLLR